MLSVYIAVVITISACARCLDTETEHGYQVFTKDSHYELPRMRNNKNILISKR